MSGGIPCYRCGRFATVTGSFTGYCENCEAAVVVPWEERRFYSRRDRDKRAWVDNPETLYEDIKEAVEDIFGEHERGRWR